MKRLLTIILIALATVSPSFAFPIKANTKTVDLSKIRGGWDSWNWTWIGKNTQSNVVTVTTDGSTVINLTNDTVNFKMSQNTPTGRVTFISQTGLSSAAGVVTWVIANTNIPPNGTYFTELWAYQTSTTNNARTLAQGTVSVVDSLYRPGDSSFPWPSVATNLADYTLLSLFNSYTQSVSVTGFLTVAIHDPAGFNVQLAPLSYSTAVSNRVTTIEGGTNGLVIDATNRVAGVGYLLPASTQSLATVTQVQTATNDLDLLIVARGYGTGDFMADGSVPMSGTLNGGGQNVTNVNNLRFRGGLTGSLSDDLAKNGLTVENYPGGIVYVTLDGTQVMSWAEDGVSRFHKRADLLGNAISNGVLSGMTAAGSNDLSGSSFLGITTNTPSAGQVPAWNNGHWYATTPAGAGDFMADGSVPMTASLNNGGFRVTNSLGIKGANGEAINFSGGDISFNMNFLHLPNFIGDNGGGFTNGTFYGTFNGVGEFSTATVGGIAASVAGHTHAASAITNGSDQFSVCVDPNTVGTNGLINLGYLSRSITFASMYGITATAGSTSTWSLLYGATNSFTPSGTNGSITFSSSGAVQTSFGQAALGPYSNRYLRCDSYNPANSNSVIQGNYAW